MDTVKFVNSNHRVSEAHNGHLHERTVVIRDQLQYKILQYIYFSQEGYLVK